MKVVKTVTADGLHETLIAIAKNATPANADAECPNSKNTAGNQPRPITANAQKGIKLPKRHKTLTENCGTRSTPNFSHDSPLPFLDLAIDQKLGIGFNASRGSSVTSNIMLRFQYL
jgi:hypothetical protein